MAKRFLVALWIAAAVVAAISAADPENPAATPGTESSTTTPDSGNPTATPDSGNPTTTPDAGNPTATTDPATPETNQTPDPSASPKPTEPTDPPVEPTTSPNPCASNPCKDGSTCEPRADQTFVCLCLPGETYDGTTCNEAKVFPGKLQLSNLKYEADLGNKESTKFAEESKKIVDALDAKFKGGELNYVGSTVLEFQSSSATSGSKWNSKADPVAVALVDISFKPDSTITKEKFEKEMGTVTCVGCSLEGTFTATDLCESSPCDDKSTTCTPAEGSFTCTCIKGYIKTEFSDRVCVACPSGMKAVEDTDCVNCPFGYSGLNCEENWKFLLVVIGSVLGGLLLITLIILPVVALKSPKKKSKKSKSEDIGKPYVSHSPAKAPMMNSNFANPPLRATVNPPANGASGNFGGPRLPRATSNTNWDNRNNLEMTPSNSRQNLVSGRNSRLNDDYDDKFSYSQSRPQINPYAQSRPQNNPYSQNRAQVNPYAERQGNTNPYYTHDDGQRY